MFGLGVGMDVIHSMNLYRLGVCARGQHELENHSLSHDPFLPSD